ncbi:MAG: domain S-box protein [Clostridiaceae bacterium]|jgi:PAS domain S-box-containing protein|nr:domain S-box protein [Clostridiaceae bacterium]
MNNVQASLSRANVLIIDDSSSNVKMLTTIFNDSNYNVRNIPENELVFQYLGENPTDIILINAALTHFDGYKICEKLKSQENLKEIPVIFIFTDNQCVNKDKFFSVGGADFITAPFNYNEVITKVGTQLKLRFMQQQVEMLNNNVLERTQQLDEITTEIKEFNVLLEEEINERTKTEEALRESERQFRYSIEEAPVPMMLFADDGKVIKINRTWTEITGYTIKDMPTTCQWGKVSYVFIKNTESVMVNTLINLKKRENDGEYSIKTINGEKRIWDFYSAYIGKMQDGRNMFLRVGIDLTVRKRMEKLQKKIEEERRKLEEIKKYDRIKTEFFANISHELRTPISVIFSALQIHELKLKKSYTQDSSIDIFKYTKIMKQNCYRLLRLINNLIDITKIDAGFFTINETNNNIVNLVREIILSVDDYIKNKGLSITFDTDIEEKIIACDPEKIERIILNLLSNAVKFTHSGGKITITIEDGAENICIRVKDTGRGIPEDKLNTIFERFVQVDKSLTRDHEGSGIGLSLVKELVELHGGAISVTSKEGCGTEFIMHFPNKLMSYEANNENMPCDTIDKSSIEKINLEFSDIYN